MTQPIVLVPVMMIEDKPRQGKYLLSCCHSTLLCSAQYCQVEYTIVALLQLLVLRMEPALRVHQLQPMKITERSEIGVDDKLNGRGRQWASRQKVQEPVPAYLWVSAPQPGAPIFGELFQAKECVLEPECNCKHMAWCQARSLPTVHQLSFCYKVTAPQTSRESVCTATLVGQQLNHFKDRQINARTDASEKLVSVSNKLWHIGRSVGRLLDVCHTSLNQCTGVDQQRDSNDGMSTARQCAQLRLGPSHVGEAQVKAESRLWKMFS